MPQYDQHTAQAEHNKKLLAFFTEQGKQKEYSDWYVTVAFYTALHYFEAVLSVKPTTDFDHSPNHAVRNKIMKIEFGTIYNHYAILYRTSRIARYECHAPDSYAWNDADAYLASVKKECEAAIL
jgi:hypothetical protein